ncbi:MAG: cytochrome c oxidase subunit II [Pseudohongiellaceae bacterium]
MANAELQTGAVQASEFAADVDSLFLVMAGLSGIVVAGIAVLILIFSIRYRRSRSSMREGPPDFPLALEYTWIAVPTLIFIGLFVWGARVFLQSQAERNDALELRVVGQQWMWMFYHPGGARELNELHIPVDRNIRLLLSSDDVIHSLYLPAFRIKQDAVPGRYTQVWLNAERTGRYRIMCAEYCGTEHSQMYGVVEVMEPEDYSLWLELNAYDTTLAAQGERLFNAMACSGCHTSGSTIQAPSLEGLYGRVVNLQDGSTVVADEVYLRDSIIVPDRDIVAGFDNVMPAYNDQLSEAQLFMLIAYIQSLTLAQ